MALIALEEISLNCEEEGKGEAAVFLHGFTGSSRDWTKQIDAVKDRYRAVAIDLRGHGKSSAPAKEEGYSIFHNSEDVFHILNKLGIERCCLVGHSMGGFSALQFILDHPEKVKGLVLVDTSSGEWDIIPGYAELRGKLDELARTEGLEAAFAYDAAHNPVRIERFVRHPDRREVARQKVLATSVDAYVYVPRSFASWTPVTGRLREIAVPTLIMCGDEDTGFFRASRILKDSIAGAELVFVPGAGHSPHEEEPDFFNGHFLRFLSRVSS
jgi:2-succinyl-6-hydroxy-2,4-cyclohexadiene-1-carboxylate synthase